MKNIPINKGNYDMDTDERRRAFGENIGAGWEDEYRAYRENWARYAKEQIVAEYPLLVDLELSSLCNLSCPMCYTITEEFKKKVNATLMEFPLFCKVVDEISGKVPALRLSLRGEPTLHPQLIDCIAYAKEKNIKEISFLTNGSALNEEMIHSLIAAGLDWITVSVDGTGAMYESVRKPLKFQDTLNSLKLLKEIKDQLGTKRPVVKVQSIWPAIRNNPEEFYNVFKECTDLIAFNPLIDYLGNDTDIEYEKGFSCPQLYQRIVVAADGAMMMCSNDEENSMVLGNAYVDSLHSVWHGEKLNEIRCKQKEEGGFMEFGVCRRCYLPRLTESEEEFSINGETYKIQNYVKRSQKVGE